MEWRFSEDERPTKPGEYMCILIYKEYRNGELTGRTVAEMDRRWFGCMDDTSWVMGNEKKLWSPNTMVWTEQTGSAEGEWVWAWMPLEDVGRPAKPLPDGVEWA